MAKKNRRNKRRSQASKLQRKFTSFSHHQVLKDAERYEHVKHDQLEYQKELSALEQSILARTIVVTGVRDLKQPNNVQLLHIFFEQYGPVESCFKADFEGSSPKKTKKSPFPPARVRFRNETDCTRVLSLAEEDLLRCPRIGCINGGYICIKKSRRYKNMTEDVLEGSEIRFSALGLALGHWTSRDVLEKFQQENEGEEFLIMPLEKSKMNQTEWLEEKQLRTKGDEHDLQVRIDLSKRIIVLSISRPTRTTGNDLLDMLLSEFMSNIQSIDEVTIGFKNVDGTMDLCRHHGGQHSFIVSLKHPPKLMESIKGGLDGFFGNTMEVDNRPKRSLSFGSLSSVDFGQCLSLRIFLSDDAVQTIIHHKGSKQLVSYGMLSQSLLNDARNALKVDVVSIGEMKQNLDVVTAFEQLHSYNASTGMFHDIIAAVFGLVMVYDNKSHIKS